MRIKIREGTARHVAAVALGERCLGGLLDEYLITEDGRLRRDRDRAATAPARPASVPALQAHHRRGDREEVQPR